MLPLISVSSLSCWLDHGSITWYPFLLKLYVILSGKARFSYPHGCVSWDFPAFFLVRNISFQRSLKICLWRIANFRLSVFRLSGLRKKDLPGVLRRTPAWLCAEQVAVSLVAVVWRLRETFWTSASVRIKAFQQNEYICSVQSRSVASHLLKGEWFAFIYGRQMQDHTQTAQL